MTNATARMSTPKQERKKERKKERTRARNQEKVGFVESNIDMD